MLRSRARRGLHASAWICVGALAIAAPAGAQEAVVAVDGPAPAERVARWRDRLEAQAGGPTRLAEAATRARPGGTVESARLEAVSALETLLTRARADRARLREGDALRSLSRAEELVAHNLDLPGIAAWYAEIQLAIAITAAQAGQRGLSEAALARAASVDPTRIVQAAEARPEVVSRARTARRARATAPRGRFEVRADVDGATIAIDDAEQGPLPRAVELPVGPHLVRIDAPGYRSWAQLVEVREGARPPLVVSLSPTTALRAAAAAERAAEAGDRDALVAWLGGWPEAPAVRLLWTGDGPMDRALTQACGAERCGALQRLEADDWPVTLWRGGDPTALAPALAWLAAEPRERPVSLALHERWELWVAVGAAALLGAAIAIGAGVDYAQREPARQVTARCPFCEL